MGFFSGIADSLFGSNKPPPAPDYRGLAQETAAGDLQSARYQTLANRPDEYTPLGSRTWQQGSGETFDQAGWDAAMAKYDASLQPPPAPSQPIGQGGGYFGPNNGPMDNRNWGYTYGGGGASPYDTVPQPLPMPDRADFTTMSDPDKWTATTQLTPEGQRLFDLGIQTDIGSGELGLQAIGQMGETFADPFSIEGQAPGYQGPGGTLPGYQGPSGQMPGYQGPGGRMPGFQGPEGDMPTYGEHRQGVMDAMLARSNTDIARDRDRTNAQLISQGIPPGSEAYNRQMEQLDRKQTDARQQAEIAAEQMAGMGYSSALAGRGMQSQESMNNFLTAMQARGMSSQEAMAAWETQMAGRRQTGQEAMADYTTGLQSRQQRAQEAMTDYSTGLKSHQQNVQDALLQRQTPINEWSAFRSGTQVQQPQFQQYGQQQFTGGPNLLGAGQMQGAYDMAGYNAGIAQDNAMMEGLMGIGAAGAYGMAVSDRRLKKNLKRLGTSVLGLPVYAFDYIWGGGRQVGVMAQDVIKVLPEAVYTDRDGYMAVDYGMIR